MGNTNSKVNTKPKYFQSNSQHSSLPRCFFFYDGLRDDTTGEYSYWHKEKCLKDLDNGKNAKLYGYSLYKQNWRNAYAVNTHNIDHYVVGRVLKFNRFDIFFSSKLQEINKANHYDPNDKWIQSQYLVKQIIANVYLENDDEKTDPIPVIVYIKHKDDSDLSNYTLIESGDWTKQNLIKSETKIVSNNHVSLCKGTTELRSSSSCTKFIEWKPNTVYKKDDIVCINPTKIGFSTLEYIRTFQFWAMCMNVHRSNEDNKPQKHEIFTDLTLNVIWFIKIYLIEHVRGFNNELSNIIILYCYETNDFWWNGCSPKDDENDICVCGNLVCGILSTDFCKICINGKSEKRKRILLSEPVKGAVITLNKTDGIRERTFVNNFDDEKKLFKDENIILRTNIVSDIEKQKIYNLLTRNFNESMTPLIRMCIYNDNYDKEFSYKHDKKDIVVNIGDTNIWCLYGIDDENIHNEQLLCALIWRYVHGESTNQTSTHLMFEVLFLSVYENVRFNHYGQQMVKQIELYCIANDYDLMTVAAVPGHGENFWKFNGFEMKHYAVKSNEKNEERSGYSSNDIYNEWMKLNMLVFDDTPLFAKLLR
eukprot:17149_1